MSPEDQSRYQSALAELREAGLELSPAYRFLSKRGLQLRPPHYNSFLFNFLTYGAAGGLLMLIVFPGALVLEGMLWPSLPPSGLHFALRSSAWQGLAVGLFMSGWWWQERRREGLSRWEDLPGN